MSSPDPADILAAAHDYARRGWRVISLHGLTIHDWETQRVGCGCGRANCASEGKHPTQSAWQNTPKMSGADIQATWGEEDSPGFNIGIATGTPSGFWVLDVDLDKPGTLERARELQAQHGKFPSTRIIKSPAGYHYYFSMPDFQVTNSAKRLPDGIDVRGTGGQVVAPPSVSKKGVYTVASEVPIVAAPDWLLDLVRPLPPASAVDLATLPKLTDLPEPEQRRLGAYAGRIVDTEAARLAECKKLGWGGPGWNNTTFEVSCALIELANSNWSPLTLEEAHAVVLADAPRDSGFDDAAVEACFTSALKRTEGKGRAYPEDRRPPARKVYEGDPLSGPTAAPVTPAVPAPSDAMVLRAWNDLGLARRMVDIYGDRLRWVRQAEDWAVYEGGAWRLAGGPAGRALAQDMVESLVEREAHHYSKEPGGPDGDKPSERDLFVKWAHGQQMSSRISACLKEATGRPELQADMTDFDAHPHLLNVANGVVDLETGELLDHDPDLLLMLQSPVRYDPNAEHPRWSAFLERCLPQPEVRDYLQKAVGYSLTGSMAEQALFIHHGSGANGKSVFLVIASHIAGSYGQVVPRETLLAKGGSATEHPTSVARMRGKRFLQASETAAGRRLDEETVKGLTGGEQQTARFMGADFFDFTPTGKIHFVTNHLPRLTDAESIWRRLHLIAWREVIPVEERDPRLAQKIIASEGAGVLRWAVEGAVRWHTERLAVPLVMREDLNDYRSDQDILGEFIESRLTQDGTGFTPTSEIYAAYSAWCYASGIKSPMTAQDLARALRERKFQQKRTSGARGFVAYLRQPLRSVDPLAIR